MRSSLYVSQPVIPESEQSLACSVLFNTIECSLHLGELLSLLKLQGCQSGRRSLMAAAELCSAGFTAVTDIAGGFSAWRENGLPVNVR